MKLKDIKKFGKVGLGIADIFAGGRISSIKDLVGGIVGDPSTSNDEAFNNLAKVADVHQEALIDHEERIQKLEKDNESLRNDLRELSDKVSG